jgi:hypothetical protein
MTRIAFAFAAFALVSSCSPQVPEPADAPARTAPPAAETPLPAVDLAALQTKAFPGETLAVVEFPRVGSRVVTGRVAGDASQAWVVPVAAGQTLTVAFAPSNANLYVNVFDAADASGAAVHRGEIDGADATLTVTADAVFIIRPFQPRAMARRDQTGDYTLTIGRS